MCGIFGYIGNQGHIEECLNGLKLLEYRGYDSAGIAGVCENRLMFVKEVGNIARLEKKIAQENISDKLSSAIAHTRWATHGKPTVLNAHPHFDKANSIAVVHNGIIENYLEIKDKYFQKDDSFYSDTDTEVVAKLISHFYEGCVLQALKKAINILKGSYALAVVHINFPDQIFAVCNKSPLCVGIGKNEAFIASDPHAFLGKEVGITYLKDKQICNIQRNGIIAYSEMLDRLPLKLEKFQGLNITNSKESFDHFMLKEIFEQPKTIEKAIEDRYLLDYGTAKFDLKITDEFLSAVKHIIIVGCGTSYHASLIGANYLEDLARIPTHAEIASELRYKNPIVSEGSLVIAISQSGETADTIAAVREAKIKGAKILSLCNREKSTLHRESDACILLNAGPEISVCSTKAFTSQVAILFLFSIYMARLRHMNKLEGQKYIRQIINLPSKINSLLNSSKKIEKIAIKYSKFKNFIFIGRRYMYPSALEAALKLKEISYINASGYPAGELKHGPIALLDPNISVVGLCANISTMDKIYSNLMESKARSAPILAITLKGYSQIEQVADDTIYLPKCIDELSVFTASIACQLFAYYVAKDLGTEIDQPKNLAKSVTVE